MSFLAIFLASTFGSLHCVGMCGGFVSLASNQSRPALSVTSYHFGRLLVYASLGALAGIFGNTLNQLGILAGIAGVAPLITGIVLAWWGILALKNGSLPAPRGKLWKRSISFLKEGSPFIPFLIGCSSAFLPCGWLYVFIATAASFGSPLLGALAMTAFWLGTVPALSALSIVARESLRISRLSPTVVAFFLILLAFIQLDPTYTQPMLSHPTYLATAISHNSLIKYYSNRICCYKKTIKSSI